MSLLSWRLPPKWQQSTLELFADPSPSSPPHHWGWGEEDTWGPQGRWLLDGSHGGLPAHLNWVMLDRSEHPLAGPRPDGIPELCWGKVRGVCEPPCPLPDGSPTCGGLVGLWEWSPSLRPIVGHTAVCLGLGRSPTLPCPELLP